MKNYTVEFLSEKGKSLPFGKTKHLLINQDAENQKQALMIIKEAYLAMWPNTRKPNLKIFSNNGKI